VFVFAAYIPPGKHLILVRDVGTDMSKSMDAQKLASTKLRDDVAAREDAIRSQN